MYHYITRVIWIMILVGLVTLCRSTGKDETDRLAVEQVLSALIEADNQGDLEQIMIYYSEDAVLMPPGGSVISGLEAIREHYEMLFSANRFIDLEAIPLEISVSNNLALIAGETAGKIQLKKDSSTQYIQGQFMMQFGKNDRDEWKIKRLIWNDSE